MRKSTVTFLDYRTMTLAGFWFSDAAGPVNGGYLPMGNVTVVLGPNDSGKTRLLQQLASWLGQDDPVAGDPRQRSVPVGRAMIFGEYTLMEKSSLLSGLDTRQRANWWSLPRAVGDVTYTKALAELRCNRRGSEAKWALIVEALAQSELLGFSRMDEQGSSPAGWGVWWCLPPEKDLDEGLTEAIQDAVGSAAFLTGDPEGPQAPHSDQADCPLPIAQATKLGFLETPRPIFVPLPYDALVAEFVEAVTDTAARLSWADASFREHGLNDLRGDDLDPNEFASRVLAWKEGFDQRRSSPNKIGHVWLTSAEGGSGASHNKYVIRSCEFLSAAATDMLPPFIAERYEVLVAPTQFPEWSESSPLKLGLRDTTTGGTFAIEQTASGFHIWLQMALLESLDELRVRIAHFYDELWWIEVGTWALEDEHERNDAEFARAAVADSLHALAEFPRLAKIAAKRERGLPEWAEQGWEPHKASSTELSKLLNWKRQILYLIDEPEQHLNPRVQREAATWLRDAMAERRSQCILTTHSAPFLSLTDGVSYSYVERMGDRASVFPFRPADLDSLSGIAAEMGFDRGDLLTRVSVFLFVEGRADQWVLETLFKDRLFAAGIEVVPVHSVGKMKAVAEAETLLKFKNAKVAVLADDLDEADIAELKQLIPDTEATQAAIDDKGLKKRTEYYAIVQLIKAAQVNRREVEIYGLGVPDVFDLLDEDLIQARFKTFPGHSKARGDFEAEKRRGGPSNFKKFYKERYTGGQELTAGLIREVADEMAERDSRPAELVELLDKVEKLAL